MAYNGSGTFVINTAGQPVVPNTVISSTAFNALTADLANGLSTCITKDGQTTPTANIPMGNNKITGLAAGTAGTDAANLSQVQGSTAKLLQSVTGTDTITAAMIPALTTYTAGQMFYFVAAGNNTGPVTINIDSLGAKSVTRDGSTALVSGDIVSGEIALIVYDGTRFQLLNGNSFTNLNVSGTLAVGSTSTFTGAATFTANPTLSAGTANGVLYLNGSKVATSGSALTFDGTNLTTTGRLNTGANLGLLLNNATGTYALWQYNGTNVGEIGVANQLISGAGTDDFAINTRQAAGDIIFAINTTEAMRLTSTGLGIGTASPAYRLHVVQNANDYAARITQSNANGSSGGLYIQQTNGGSNGLLVDTTGAYGNCAVFNGGNVGIGTASPAQKLHVAAAAGVQGLFKATGAGSSYIRVDESAGTLQSIFGTDASVGFCGMLSNHDFTFRTNNTERGRFTAGGDFRFGVGATNSGIIDINVGTGTGGRIIDGVNSAGNRYFEVQTDGDVYNTNGTYGTISDARLKQDIIDAPSQWNDLKAIRFRKYRMKSDVEADPNAPALFGVVAQELEQVCPGLVDDGEIKTVKSSILLMKAAKALQEAMARIESLEAKVSALEAK